MPMDLIPVGFANYVAASRLVAIANPASLPIKRLIRHAEEKGLVVDLTSGRKVKAVLVLDTQHVILVSRQPETIAVAPTCACPGPVRAPGGRTCLMPAATVPIWPPGANAGPAACSSSSPGPPAWARTWP